MSDQFAEARTAIEFFDVQLNNIRGVLAEFPEEAIWQRTPEGLVSLGNLVCHVAGSMRDWFENGLAQGDWQRDRPYEFERDGDLDRDALQKHLDETREHCGAFLDEVTDETWEQTRRFRDKEYRVREILWHQVEHVAYHAGQAAFLRRLTGGLPPKP